jgi:hypothetical protein
MSLSKFYRALLEEFPHLPPTAVIPIPVAAVIEGCSRRTIRRNYELEKISECRWGVRKKNLRGAGESVPRQAADRDRP